MTNYTFNPHHVRVRKARLARRFGKGLANGLKLVAIVAVLLGLGTVLTGHYIGYAALAVASAAAMPVFWYRWDLSVLPPGPMPKQWPVHLEEVLPAEMITGPWPLNPRSLWKHLEGHWQRNFVLNHLLIHPDGVTQVLSENPADFDPLWGAVFQFAAEAEVHEVDAGVIALGIIAATPALGDYLASLKLARENLIDVAAWEQRLVHMLEGIHVTSELGGFARDWAAGYTPTLDRYGLNVSLAIGKNHSFGWLADTPVVDQLITQLDQGGRTNVALLGESGSGKTSMVYAMAVRLLEGRKGGGLTYRQIVSLDPATILSNNPGPGQLEAAVLALLGEALHAGNIILFFDHAELFFGSGTGAINLSQLLLPVLQSSQIKIIAAFEPTAWERLVSTSPALANLFYPLRIPPPTESETLKILEDKALSLEGETKKVVTYGGLREIYRLGSRFTQNRAMPGAAVQLLDDVVRTTAGEIVTEAEVQVAVEQMTGVKVGKAEGAEATELLDLEGRIHRRMINQDRAVSVVSDALRRARAGVRDVGRPIGSFLFLGPTGVGKTELAKALAEAYFGSENQLVRLDMSEYQTEADVQRLLAGGGDQASLLLMVRKQPFAVVLLDEVEKAHPNILNLLLQLLDEGQLTDVNGQATSFKDTIIIATSNAGADEIRTRIGKGEELESFEEEFTNHLIDSHLFRPELLNRFDEIVLFRPLSKTELLQVVGLMIEGVNKTLAEQNVRVEVTQAAAEQLIAKGYDPRLGARPMRRMVQRTVENVVAQRLLRGQIQTGQTVTLDVGDLGQEPVPAESGTPQAPRQMG